MLLKIEGVTTCVWLCPLYYSHWNLIPKRCLVSSHESVCLIGQANSWRMSILALMGLGELSKEQAQSHSEVTPLVLLLSLLCSCHGVRQQQILIRCLVEADTMPSNFPGSRTTIQKQTNKTPPLLASYAVSDILSQEQKRDGDRCQKNGTDIQNKVELLPHNSH